MAAESRAHHEAPDSAKDEPHLACTRKFNRMRITDLEAIDIARAFAEKPNLLGKLPQVYERIAKEIPYLRDNEEPQPFDCPLLDGKNCMVHRIAKPIACLAWNPGRDYTTDGWHSFSRRDKLNQELFGEEWDLKAIPLQLSRFLEGQDRTVLGPCGSTLRKKAMRRGELRSKRDRETVEKDARVAERQLRRGRRGAARHERNDGPVADGSSSSRGLRSKAGRSPTTPRRGESSNAGDRRAAGRRGEDRDGVRRGASPGRQGPSDSRPRTSSRQARAMDRRGGDSDRRTEPSEERSFSKRGPGRAGPPASRRSSSERGRPERSTTERGSSERRHGDSDRRTRSSEFRSGPADGPRRESSRSSGSSPYRSNSARRPAGERGASERGAGESGSRGRQYGGGGQARPSGASHQSGSARPGGSGRPSGPGHQTGPARQTGPGRRRGPAGSGGPTGGSQGGGRPRGGRSRDRGSDGGGSRRSS